MEYSKSVGEKDYSDLLAYITNVKGAFVTERERHESDWLKYLHIAYGKYTSEELSNIAASGDASANPIYVPVVASQVRGVSNALMDAAQNFDFDVVNLRKISGDPTTKEEDDAVIKAKQEIKEYHELSKCMTREALLCFNDAATYGYTVSRMETASYSKPKRWQDETTRKWISENEVIDYPAPRYVPIWNLYFDQNAKDLQSGRGVTQLHVLDKSELRKWGKGLGWDNDAITRLLENNTTGEAQQAWESSVQSIKEEDSGISADGKVRIWEFWGPVLVADAKKAGMNLNVNGLKPDELTDADYIEVVCTFCGDEVLKAAVNPFYPTYKRPFYKAELDIKPNSPYGQGICEEGEPYGRIINGKTRARLANLTWACRPGWVRNKDLLANDQPDESVGPGFVIDMANGTQFSTQKALELFLVPDVTVGLVGEIHSDIADMEHATGFSRQSAGTGGAVGAPTALGASIVASGASLQMRQRSNHFDAMFASWVEDEYDWLMRYGKNEGSKSDAKVVITGSVKTAMTKELQGKRLNELFNSLSNPILYAQLEQRLKWTDLLREYAHALDIQTVVKTDKEVADDQIAAAKKQGEVDRAMADALGVSLGEYLYIKSTGQAGLPASGGGNMPQGQGGAYASSNSPVKKTNPNAGSPQQLAAGRDTAGGGTV